jgi:hypothetical protein
MKRARLAGIAERLVAALPRTSLASGSLRVRRPAVGVLALLLLAPGAAGAADALDGSKALVCDLAEAAECDGVAACADVSAEQIDLPPVIHVDFAASKLVSASDETRTSPIVTVEKLDAVLVLQGHQNGRAWTMVIDRATGHLTATLADAEGAFVLAGACAPR